MQVTDRYVADELEPLFGPWQIGAGRDLRLDRPVVLVAAKDVFAHRAQLDHWLGKRAPVSHPYVAPLLDCAEGKEWFACVFEGVGATPGLPDLPLSSLFQACQRITDGAEELLRARVPFVFSAGQILFDRGEPRLIGLPDLTGTALQDGENVGRLSQFFAHAIEWKFVAPRDDEIASSGVWEMAMRKLRGEGAPKPVTMISLRTILQALAVEADLLAERNVAAPGKEAVGMEEDAARERAAKRWDSAVRQAGQSEPGLSDATIRVDPVTSGMSGINRRPADETVRMETDERRAPQTDEGRKPAIEPPTFVLPGRSTAQTASIATEEVWEEEDIQEEPDDPNEWEDDDDPRSVSGRALIWGVGAVVVLALFVVAMVLSGRPHAQASPAVNPSGATKGQTAGGGARPNSRGAGSGSPSSTGGGAPTGGHPATGAGGASTGRTALSSLIGLAPSSAVGRLTADGYRAGQIDVTAITSGTGRGLVTAAKRTASGAVSLTVGVAPGQALVPDLAGLTTVSAGNLLIADHFHFRYTLQSHPGTKQGIVYSQQPAAYTLAAQWSTVGFTAEH